MDENNSNKLILANWPERIISWVIDFVIVLVGLVIFYSILIIPLLIFYGNFGQIVKDIFIFHYFFSGLVFFIYWSYFESTTGQSLGKMIMNLKTTNIKGERASVKEIAIESFGKSFLLPLDVILGWIFADEKRQRVFNRFSDTIVIKIK